MFLLRLEIFVSVCSEPPGYFLLVHLLLGYLGPRLVGSGIFAVVHSLGWQRRNSVSIFVGSMLRALIFQFLKFASILILNEGRF